jgi:hypothetical protein
VTAPVVESSQNTARTAVETTSLINYPTTVSPGALIIVTGRINVAGALTMPGGWTALFPDDTSDASDDVTVCYYQTAVGNEDGTTFSVTHGSGKSAWVSVSLTGAHLTPYCSALTIGTNTTPDPAALTPAPGSQDWCWLWMGAWDGIQTNPPATPPSGYTLVNNAGTSTASTAASNSRNAVYRKYTTAQTTENPGSLTISTTPTGWTAWTVGVCPPLAATTAPSVGMLAA